ncbi:FAD-dependent hydroxylase [Stenomitos frigidus]|uniref:2-octaprenyl-6-methoxyphenyl hydroxylase n=1 Tax=Stenomitos frigidus ULC18 TaxID=2107698 RepID=A0A2T1ENK5_9CYAN|nr:FAD-dependent hydroxylase [Stenomitos frigidus]PSB34330.1 2-octaprenyl-6-methoxyphenyl hydroxylase [Stenomitos frigidus ULC18]
MTLEQLDAIVPPNTLQASAAASLEPTLKRVDYDVVIVGGGLVGMTLACALKHSGLQVALLEAKPQSDAVARGQAYHINLSSSRIFDGMGVWRHMRPGVNPIAQIRLSDAGDPEAVQFVPQDLGTDVLGYVAEHRVLLEALRTAVSECANVTYVCPAALVHTSTETDGVTLEVLQAGATHQLRTRLLVAADGSRSSLRQQARIRTRGWQYWQACVVAFIKPEEPHHNIAYERFQTDGPFAILPLPNNLCRIVWTAPKAEAEALMALDDEHFLRELKQRYGDQMGTLSLVGERYVFPVQLMQSDRYVLPRLALIGDAAHCCHPVGGQGVNLGIRDAAALAQILQTAHQQGQDIGALQVLRPYERWRKRENLLVLGFTDVLNRMFSNRVLPLVVLRRLGLWTLRSLRPAKRIALTLMTGLSGRVPTIAQRPGKEARD